MRLDLVVPNQGPFALEAVRACAQFEEIGYRGLWFTDHIVAFDSFRPVYGPYWLDLLSVLSYAAATTRTVRLGAGVMVVPYRDGVYSAKALATLDVLSNGRLDLGVGTGWSRAEFYALGREHLYEERGPYTDEAIDVMLQCWKSEGPLTYQGRYARFRNLEFEPTPVQRPHIPIWVGARGASPAPLRRAARFADVWHPSTIPPEEMREASDRLNNLAGREIPTSIRVRPSSGASTPEIVELLASYAEAGCIQAAVEFQATSFGSFLASAQALAEAAIRPPM